MSQAMTFLKALWNQGFPGGSLLIWSKNDEDKASEWFDTLHQDIPLIADHLSKDHDVYVGCALRRNSMKRNERGSKSDCWAIPGVWIDVDYGQDGHKSKKLPPTREDAMGLINGMGALPTAIVNSGYGCQAWWLFKEPLVLDSKEEASRAERLTQGWCDVLRMHAHEKGWTQDVVGDLPRVMRLPGTTNHKRQDAVPVRIESINADRRYDPSDILQIIEENTQLRASKPLNDYEVEQAISTVSISKSITANPPLAKMVRLMRSSQDFSQACARIPQKGQADDSQSIYDFRLASLTLADGWSHQEVTDLLIAHRRDYGQPEKISHKTYYERTIARAGLMNAGKNPIDTPDSALATDVSIIPTSFSDEERSTFLAAVSKRLKVNISKVTKYDADPPFYEVVVNGTCVKFATIERITDRMKFINTVLSCANIMLHLSKETPWHEIVQLMVKSQVTVKVEMAKDKSVMQDYIDGYIEGMGDKATDDYTQENWEDMCAQGFPFFHDGKVHMRTKAFSNYIRAIDPKITSRSIAETLSRMGYVSIKMNYHNQSTFQRTTCMCWIEPSEVNRA